MPISQQRTCLGKAPPPQTQQQSQTRAQNLGPPGFFTLTLGDSDDKLKKKRRVTKLGSKQVLASSEMVLSLFPVSREGRGQWREYLLFIGGSYNAPGTIFEALYVQNLIKSLLCSGKPGIVVLILSRGRPKFRRQSACDLMAGWMTELRLDPGVENVDACAAHCGSS